MTDHKPSDEVFAQAQPLLCAGNCGFFGNSATANMCSVCYKHHTSSNSGMQIDPETAPVMKEKVEAAAAQAVATPAPTIGKAAIAAEPAMEEVLALGGGVATDMETETAAAAGGAGGSEGTPPEQVNTNRCYSCNKRVGFTGFKCRCEFTYCAAHRHSTKHNCTFDYKALGRDAVAKANPAVIKDKVDSRI
mmetsp:Transcript_19743/g.48907  ORF Transcript_19743/g.48907 Transcript_19743/m.48907 type:complete len:191 (-) Transcript_19743:326-898(-)